MPIYCYRDPGGFIHERHFRMKEEIPRAIRLDDGREAERDLAAEHGGPLRLPGTWPLLSDAMGVHPSQIRDAQSHSVKIGIPTEFSSDGRAVFTSAAHRRDYCRALGFHDRNGGYSDP